MSDVRLIAVTTCEAGSGLRGDTPGQSPVGAAGQAPLALLHSSLFQTHSLGLSGLPKLTPWAPWPDLDLEVRGAPAHAHKQQEVPRPVDCGVLCQTSHVRLLNSGRGMGPLTEHARKPIRFLSLF